MKPTIFFSHSWRDKELPVLPLLERALKQDYIVWIDQENLEYGETIQKGVREGIEKADLILVLWSENAHHSKGVKFEIETARILGKKVIPVRISDFHPNESTFFDGVKYFDLNYSKQDKMHFELGMNTLTQYLKEVWLKNLNVDADDRMRHQMEAMKEVQADVRNMLYREEQGFTGNEHSGIYFKALLASGKKMAESGDFKGAEKERLDAFFKMAQDIFMKHPGAESDVEVEQEILKEIDAIDPKGESDYLQEFKKAGSPKRKEKLKQEKAPPPPPPEALYTKPRYQGSPVAAKMMQHIQEVAKQPGSDERLRQQIIAIVPHYHAGLQPEVERAIRVFKQYVEDVPRLLDNLADAARMVGILPLIEPLISQCVQYFFNPSDLIPDHLGLYGLLDDAYMAKLTVHNLSFTYQQSTGRPLLNINLTLAATEIRHIIGEPIAQQLDHIVNTSIYTIVQQYQFQQLVNWGGTVNVPGATGAPGSWGGSQEDELARVLAGLGA